MKIIWNKFAFLTVLIIASFIISHFLAYVLKISELERGNIVACSLYLVGGLIFLVWFFLPFKMHFNVIGYSITFGLVTVFYVILTKSFEILISSLSIFWSLGILYLYFNQWKLFDKYSKSKEDLHEVLRFDITALTISILLSMIVFAEFYPPYLVATKIKTDIFSMPFWFLSIGMICMLWLFYYLDKKSGRIKTPEDVFKTIRLSSFVAFAIATFFFILPALVPVFFKTAEGEQSILTGAFAIIMYLVALALWESYANRKRYEYHG